MTFSFIILLAITRNIVVSVLSIFSVGVVILSVLCIMVLKGYELGVSESICVVISIGLSVDYVVHLAQDYMHSSHKNRSSKMKQAYTEMGVSIFSGTITTFGAGLALFGGTLNTFQKFAVIITSTVGISFLTSMLFFGALLHLMGPQNGWGDICFCAFWEDPEVKKREEELKEEYGILDADQMQAKEEDFDQFMNDRENQYADPNAPDVE